MTGGKTFARIGAIVFVACAITATAIEIGRKEETPAEDLASPPILAPVDPLRVELRRCQALGEAGAREPACLAAWAENRRRFLSPGPRPAEQLQEPVQTPDLGSPLPANPGMSVDEAQPDLGPPMSETPATQCGALAELGVIPDEC
jgi:conjugative transfer region protein TrbK